MPQIQVISDCPKCRSTATGIIKYGSSLSTQKEMLKGANIGYYVIVRPKQKDSQFDVLPNRFCSECRYEWLDTDDKERERLSAEEYREYLEERGLWEMSIKNQKCGFIMRAIKKAIQKSREKGE